MIPVVEILPHGGEAEPCDDVATLDYDARHRRRIVSQSDGGLSFMLDLPHAVTLRDGDRLKLSDGRIVRIIAAAQPLLQVEAHDAAGLLRLAWHLGNRHLTAQIETARILIRRDPVIAHMLEHLGAQVVEIEAPFNPEGGAYGGAHQAHDH